MHERLLQYIRSYSTIPLSQSDIEMLKSIFVPKKLRKRQYFLQEGEVCKYNAFIVKGAMRQYSVDNKGVERIVELFLENWWAGDLESLLRSTPSIYFVDAWEETNVLLYSRKGFDALQKIPAITDLSRRMTDQHTFDWVTPQTFNSSNNFHINVSLFFHATLHEAT